MSEEHVRQERDQLLVQVERAEKERAEALDELWRLRHAMTVVARGKLRLEKTVEGAVFTYGILHTPSGAISPLSLAHDDWAIMETLFAFGEIKGEGHGTSSA